MSSSYRYVGPGRFYGVPARDLTPEDYDALDRSDRRKVRSSAIYVEVPAPAPKAPPKPPAKPSKPSKPTEGRDE